MLKNLRIEVDAHTHTVMSGHAWSTIQENCAAAAQKGMKALCMTDHGFCMKGTGTIWTPWSFSQLPDVIGGIRVYPGMEFNLWDTEATWTNTFPARSSTSVSASPACTKTSCPCWMRTRTPRHISAPWITPAST